MIYFLHGTNTHKARAKLHEMLETLSKKRPNSEIFKITSENWSDGQFDELLASQGLFDQKYIVVLDGLFEKKEIKECVLERLVEMADAENVFLILEGKVDAPTLKKFEKTAKQVQEFAAPENKKEALNIFALSDWLLNRDKKSLWVSYREMLSKGAGPEEIHGILFWQIKNMILAGRSDSQQESGLAPFPYRKALTGTRKYKSEELQSMSGGLVEMTHRVRKGDGDLDIMLEKWILSL